ncbi:MAG TPA: tyrosinase family protein [Solirubrobacterales bacterium]
MATPHRSPINPRKRIRHRKSIAKLRPDQLTALRTGFRRIQRLRDTNGFWYWAGIHGAPRYQCQHSPENGYDNLFLPWHRAYLYRLELALQTKEPRATLPWWDWPSSRSAGIPPAFAEQEIGGEPNPLAGSDLPPLLTEREGWPAHTWRQPRRPEELPDAQRVREILELPNFDDFSLQLEEQLHDRVHGWVGGTMKQVAVAAYDPIFWAHHTMVDRLWSLWQTTHSSRGPRPTLWRQVLRGLDMTVEDVLDTTALGYDYAGSTASRLVRAREAEPV